MTRFHNKFHKKNHHTDVTPNFPDSASDPIASPSDPFMGDFFMYGNLSAHGYIYADRLYADGTLVQLSSIGGIDPDVDDLSAFTLALDTRVDTLSTFTLELDTRVDTLSTFVNKRDITLTAGEDLDIGVSVYLKSDGKFWRTDASLESTSGPVLIGIVTTSVNADEDVTVRMFGNFTTTGLVVGSIYYLSTATGLITTTAPSGDGEIVRSIGYATSSTNLLIDPDQSYIEIGTSSITFKTNSIFNGIHSVDTQVTNLSSGNVGETLESTLPSTQTFYVPSTAYDFSEYDTEKVPVSLDIVQIGDGLFNVSAFPGSTIIGNGVSSGQASALTIYRRPSTDTWVLIGGTT